MPVPAAPTAAELRSRALALAAAAALHVLIPVGLLVYYALWPVAAPPAQEIPVEVVVEQPPPKPDKPKDQPKPPPEPEIEKPAYDAPRAATAENVNRDSPDRKTEGPVAKSEPTPDPGVPEKAQQSQAAPTEERQANKAPPPPDLKTMPGGDEPAAAAPARSDAEPNPEAASKPAPELPAKAPVGMPLPTIEVLPEYKFARAGKETPIATGNAESRYLTIVKGLIDAHFHVPPSARGIVFSKPGVVEFFVDEGGNLVGRKVVNSSGSQSLDMAVMAAIAEAAPYPSPPHWVPVGITYTFWPR